MKQKIKLQLKCDDKLWEAFKKKCNKLSNLNDSVVELIRKNVKNEK